MRRMMVKVALLVCLLMVCAATQVIGADFQKGIDAAQKGDYSTALKELKPLAEQGDARAQFFLGRMYSDYEEPTGDLYKSFDWMFKAAEQGLELAIRELENPIAPYGNILEDRSKLTEYYEKTIKGLPQYLFQHGSLSLLLKDTDKAIRYLTQAAERGDQNAQAKLGLLFYRGTGVEQDYKKAFDWISKAIEQGNAAAQFYRGMMCMIGEGVPQDNKQAVKWFTKAAEQGYADAQFGLAGMYGEGQGVLQDYKEAFEWYIKAAEHGHVRAQFELALMYDEGKGVPQDYKQAVKWYIKAAEQGDADAQCNLGIKYVLGQGVTQDIIQAYAWFNVASAQGVETARKGRGIVLEDMTADQITKGQELSKQLYNKIYSGQKPEG